MAFLKVQSPAVALYTSLSGSGTSMVVAPYPVDLDGNKLTMGALGANPQLTVDPKVSAYEEIIGFTGIIDNGNNTATLTGLVRDMASSNLATPGTGKQHGAGAIVIISWNPQDVARLAALENDQTFTGLNTFSQSPTVPSPSNPTDGANKSYVDTSMQAGGADASTTVKGVTRLATSPNVTKGTVTVTIASPAVFSFSAHGLTAGDTIQLTTSGALPTGLAPSTTYYVIAAGLTTNAFEVSATFGGTAINTSGSQSGTHTLIKTTPISVGDNDLRVNQYWVDTGSANTYAITPVPAVATYAVGQQFIFKAVNANTTASTLAVNGLSAIAIKKLSGTALVANDILAGAMVKVVYDGTNFQMISQIGNAPIAATLDTDGTLAADSDTRIASQKATKTYVDTLGAAKVLGTWGSATVDGNGHQVATDGFLVGYASTSTGTADASVTIKSDSASTPTTVRYVSQIHYAGAVEIVSYCVPIKKGDYYSVAVSNCTSTNAYFLPFGN